MCGATCEETLLKPACQENLVVGTSKSRFCVYIYMSIYVYAYICVWGLVKPSCEDYQVGFVCMDMWGKPS